MGFPIFLHIYELKRSTFMLFIDPNQMPERKDGKIRRGARASYVTSVPLSSPMEFLQIAISYFLFCRIGFCLVRPVSLKIKYLQDGK